MTPQANLDAAQAQRDLAAADVQAAQAQVETAKINLGYTQITSPIDGRIGHANVTKGNVVGPSTGPLARVVQLDPIRVVFSVDDRTLTNARQQNQGVPLEQLSARYVPTLRLGNGQMYPEKGKIDFVDNQVDPNTGTVAVWASFANPNGLLLPNQFTTVVIHPDQKEERPVVPLAAVQQDQQGQYVFVVGDGDHVQQRRIQTDFQVGQDLVVKSGLREGETIVVQGLQKVKPGAQVRPVAQQDLRPGGAATASSRSSRRRRARRCSPASSSTGRNSRSSSRSSSRSPGCWRCTASRSRSSPEHHAAADHGLRHLPGRRTPRPWPNSVAAADRGAGQRRARTRCT